MFGDNPCFIFFPPNLSIGQKLTKRKILQPSDAAFKTYIEQARQERPKNAAPTGRVPPSTSRHQPTTDLSTKEIMRRAQIYFMGVSGCKKNSKLYTQEVQHMVDIAGTIMKRTANIRLLYSGDTEILTQ